MIDWNTEEAKLLRSSASDRQLSHDAFMATLAATFIDVADGTSTNMPTNAVVKVRLAFLDNQLGGNAQQRALRKQIAKGSADQAMMVLADSWAELRAALD